MNRKTALILLFVLFLAWPTVSAAGFDVYGKAERFTWSEYDSTGVLLKESGPIFTIGLIRKTPNPDHSFTRTDIAYFGGSVQYNGATWAGTPVVSDTNYSGFKLEYTVYNPTSEAIDGYAFLGLGYKQWNRDLLSTQVSQGYLEKWKSLYAKIGFRQETATSRYEVGLKYPFRNENRVDLFAATTNPGRHASIFGEVGWTVAKDVDVSLTYDSMKFTASQPVYSPVLGFPIYQPKSDSATWGLQLTAKL